jgi:hypothetical protein
MTKYISNRLRDLNVGVSSYSDSKTSLQVTGRVGIGTTNAEKSLDVKGNVRIQSDEYDLLTLSTLDPAGRSSIKFNVSGDDWELGSRGSDSDAPNSFYIYDTNSSSYRAIVDTNGNVILGGVTTATGTANQPLQVFGGGYFSGNVGIATTVTNGYELYVNGDANITGIISASAFYGNGENLTDLIQNISVSKIEGIIIKDNGTIVGTSATAIDFGDGLNATYGSGIATITSSASSAGISSIQVRYNDINIGTGSSVLNFTGTGISSVTSSPIGITTIRVDLQSNLDGGLPDSNYGGIEAIEGGGI